MGLNSSRLVSWSLSLAFLSGTLFAAPQLRLEETTVGPVSIPAGQDGLLQTVEAYNAGDGGLQLAVQSSDAWLEAAIGANRACSSRAGICTPINIRPRTAGLAKGIHTGTVTVLDPNAVDAPQTITVTVQMDGGVPDQVELYVTPNGGSDTFGFQTNTELTFTTATQAGGPWLSMSLEAGGSFRFVLPYTIRARHPAGLAEGVYNGTVNINNSAFAPNIKAVPVSMQVTSQPIALLNANELNPVLAADSLEMGQWLVINNRGLGNLTITSAEAELLNGEGWLTLEPLEGTTFINVKANPAGLAPGLYQATITVQTNAVNSPHVVPVNLTVEAQQGPISGFQGVGEQRHLRGWSGGGPG